MRAVLVLFVCSAAATTPANKKPAALSTAVAQHDCTYKSPDGSVFDLSPLTRAAGQSDWSVSDGGFVYLLNVCGDIVDKPPSCQAGVHSAAYQYEPGSNPPHCYFLGQTVKHEWSLADPAKPWKGIELVYHDGQLCPHNKKPRQIRFHFICSHGFSAEESTPLYVKENTQGAGCHYNVTWPTTHGCPVVTGAGDGGGCPTSHLLLYPGLSVLLWGAGLAMLGFLLNMCAGGGAGCDLSSCKLFASAAPKGRYGTQNTSKGRLIDNTLPNDFPDTGESDF